MWFCGVLIFSIVAERRRSSDAMTSGVETYVQSLLVLGILMGSMMLRTTWILSSSYEGGALEVDENEGTPYTEDCNMKFDTHDRIFADLAGWYRSTAWKRMSGSSETMMNPENMDGANGNDGTVTLFTNNFSDMNGHERMGSHSAVMDLAVHLRAFSDVPVDSMLKGSSGMHLRADIDRTVGVNGFMIWHAIFLLLMM